MSSDVQTLMEMGFPQNRAEKALAKTSYKGVQQAMDWLFAHSEDADIDDPIPPQVDHVLGSKDSGGATELGIDQSADTGETSNIADHQSGDCTEPAPAEAKSLKCDDCGKILKSQVDVQAHAARTQHSNFSESTDEIRPLTEDERKAQLDKIQERLKQKRLEKEETEKQEQLAREKMRRTTGKDMVKAKQKLEEDEIKRMVEMKKREKMEEKLARQKIKEDIEKDKRERAAKFQTSSRPAEVSPQPAPQAASPPPTTEKKEYTDCRLQIRLPNGEGLTQTFSAREPLAAVRLYVEMNRTDGSSPFSLMTSFPRKVFTSEDMDKPLTELGLVPSAVLIVTKT